MSALKSLLVLQFSLLSLPVTLSDLVSQSQIYVPYNVPSCGLLICKRPIIGALSVPTVDIP